MIGEESNVAAGALRPGAVVEDQSAAIALLTDPATFECDAVETIETHGAYVFLASDRAYKLKRAVWFPYMDFSSLAKRREACEAELRLNRRTAPDIYLDLLPITQSAEGILALDGEGEPIDWVVVMRRFDQDGLFDRLAQRGALDDRLVEALADEIARFHNDAETSPGTDLGQAISDVVDGNTDSLRSWIGRPFREDDVSALHERCRDRIANSQVLLAQRTRNGFARRCHGDLHLRNICLIDDKPTLFDCIEFSVELATIDVLYDLAFLLMDLEHRGLRRLANLVLNRYLARTGDYGGLSMLPLYLATRAAVRAHVDAATAQAHRDAPEAREQESEAKTYLDLALRLAQPGRPMLVAVGGLSGSGKSTLARSLAPDLGAPAGAVVMRSDVLRKRLFGVDLFAPLPEAAYAPEHSETVYRQIIDHSRQALAGGLTVIADAVYGKEEERRAIAAAAQDLGVPFCGLWLDISESAQRRRLEARRHDVSDADVAVGMAQRSAEVTVDDWATLDADRDLPSLVAAAVACVDGAGSQ